MMRIREATPADLPAITEIYAHHVLHGAGTFEEVPPDEADMAGRMKKVLAGRGNVWLVAELIARAEAAGFRQMLAIIGDSENVGSIGLHVSLGFRNIGTMRAVGMKFGRWVDVVTMQRSLGEGEKTLPAD
jgi:phosphinothricin acetyltransferase